jgi:hypothetical protein
MKTITIKPESIKEIRKAMRSLESWSETLYIEGICQITKTGHTGYAYGPTPENDDSDPMTDYSAWSYGWKEKWILEDIKRTANIA